MEAIIVSRILRKIPLVSVAVALTIVAAPPSARAADPGFCRQYADVAVDQFRRALQHEHCAGYVRTASGRWSGRHREHFDWCLGVPPEAAHREQRERSLALEACARRRY